MSEMIEAIRDKVGNKPAEMLEKISRHVTAESIGKAANECMHRGKKAAKKLMERIQDTVRKRTE